MAQWEIAHEVRCDDNYYDRYWHDTAGAAVVFDGDRGEDREFLVLINGAQFYVKYPDGLERYLDRGNPIAVRIRWDAEWGWTLYCYVFHGSDNPRVEWKVVGIA